MAEKRLVTLIGSHGEEVLFEVIVGSPQEEPLIGAVLSGGEAIEVVVAGQPVESLTEIGESLSARSRELIQGFVDDPSPALTPAEVEIEFGVKLTGKARLIFVEGTAESHLHVKIKWDLRKSRTQG